MSSFPTPCYTTDMYIDFAFWQWCATAPIGRAAVACTPPLGANSVPITYR